MKSLFKNNVTNNFPKEIDVKNSTHSVHAMYVHQNRQRYLAVSVLIRIKIPLAFFVSRYSLVFIFLFTYILLFTNLFVCFVFLMLVFFDCCCFLFCFCFILLFVLYCVFCVVFVCFCSCFCGCVFCRVLIFYPFYIGLLGNVHNRYMCIRVHVNDSG